MDRMKQFFLAVLATATGTTACNAAATDQGTPIEIVVKTKWGEYIDVESVLVIDLSEGATPRPMPVFQVGKGRYEALELNCTWSIRYDIKLIDSNYFRDPGNPIRCGGARVEFDDIDYGLASLDYLSAEAAYGQAETWSSAFGTSDLSYVGPADRLAAAVRAEDYGTVAIGASELAAQLRGEGLSVEAEFFAKISYDATLKGAVKEAPGRAAQIFGTADVAATEVDERNVVRITPEAKAFLEAYQQETFGWSNDDRRLGNTGWATMRELSTVESLDATEFVLPPESFGSIADVNLNPAFVEQRSPAT